MKGNLLFYLKNTKKQVFVDKISVKIIFLTVRHQFQQVDGWFSGSLNHHVY